jgi:hypothetical protein
MNDEELDQTIRSGLASMIDRAHEPAPFPTDPAPGPDIPAQTPPRRGHGTRRVRYLSIAAALVAVVVGLSVWTISDDDRGGIDAVQDAPDEPSGFAGWEPGWHTLDPGPVPAMNGAQMTWTGERLIVFGRHVANAGETVAQVFSYDPPTGEWTELPRPPRQTNRIVAAGDTLVVVGFDDGFPTASAQEWATLAPGADEWTSHGPVPQSPALARAGVTGVGVGREQLVWTGSRVVDVGLGAVLDPATGDAAELPMPADVVAYTQLLSATPVWTGEQVVLSSWSDRPGLAWDALGTDWQNVPGPVADDWPRSSGSASPAALAGSDVVLVSDGTEDGSVPSQIGYSASLDPGTGEWTRLSDIPGPSNTTCPYRLTAVGDTPIVQPCDNGYKTPLRLVGDTWSEIGSPPFTEGTWLGTDQALIVWSTDVDTLNNPRAPYVEAAVWIPPSEPASSDEPAANTPNPAPGIDSTAQPSSSPVQSDTGVRYRELGELAPNSAPSTKPIAATNEAELEEMWSQLGQPAATTPEIDFDNDIVLAATAPGSGCRSELTRIEIREGELTVMLTSPDRECTLPLLLWTTVLAVERDQLPASFALVVPTRSEFGYDDAYLAVELS